MRFKAMTTPRNSWELYDYEYNYDWILSQQNADLEYAKVRLLGGSMLRIITLNANGIRSAQRKGLFEWLSTQKADILCLQETKAHAGDLQDPITAIQGYRAYFCDAEKKGYCGVAMYLRTPPDKVTHGLGWADFDREGRFLQADYGPLSVISVYVPSGSSSAERQQAKFIYKEGAVDHAPLLMDYRITI